EGQFGIAADWFRTSGAAGFRHSRLPALTAFTLVRSARGPGGEVNVKPVEQAVAAIGPQPSLVIWLARAHRRQRRYADAWEALDRLDEPDANAMVQKGLLHLAEGRLPAAEIEFSAAVELDPRLAVAHLNLLFTRLSSSPLAGQRELIEKCARM